MKQKRQWILRVLVALVLIILGGFILAKKEVFEQVFVIALGVVAIITGINSLSTMNKYSFGRFNRGSTLVKGIISIIIGVLAVVLPLAVGGTVWRIILYVLAAQLLLSAIVMLIDAFAVRAVGFSPTPLIVEGLVSLALAAFLFLFPRSVADLLITILGIIVIVVGVTIGLLAFYSRNKNVDITVEAVDVEVDEN